MTKRKFQDGKKKRSSFLAENLSKTHKFVRGMNLGTAGAAAIAGHPAVALGLMGLQVAYDSWKANKILQKKLRLLETKPLKKKSGGRPRMSRR